MKIHCVCVVRDEADILEYTLDAALKWADAIYVLDNGSTDGTWELLQDYSRQYRQIELVGRYSGRFYNAVRGTVANQFLNRATKGDWWCRLDADEMYADDPRQFLARISRRHQVVYAICLNYFFTEVDLALYEQDPGAYLEEWSPERLRFYTTNWSDIRFVRHVPGVEWQDEWPPDVWYMRPSPKRILMRHYDYRSPPQIERRIHLRTHFTEEGRFIHEKMKRWVPMGLAEEDVVFPGPEGMVDELWRSRVVRSSAVYRDDQGTPMQINWSLLPPIYPPLPRHLRFARRMRRWLQKTLPGFVGEGVEGVAGPPVR